MQMKIKPKRLTLPTRPPKSTDAHLGNKVELRCLVVSHEQGLLREQLAQYTAAIRGQSDDHF